MKARASGIVAGALIAAASFASFAAGLPAHFEGSSTLQAEGVVEFIDHVKHSVTVRDAHGGEASFDITNTHDLERIQPGGKVHIRMMRNAVISVTRGADGQGSIAPVAQPNPEQNVSAEVQAIDHASGVMALKGSNGSMFHIQGRDPAKLASVTPGMQVLVAFAKQINVAVAPAE